MATAPSPNDLTRQQLDELDALLQRMLSVPLAETPLPAAAPPAQLPTPSPTTTNWRIDPPAPANVSTPHIAIPELKYEAELKYEPPAPVAKAAPPQPVAPAPAPQPVTPTPAPQVTMPAPQPVSPAPQVAMPAPQPTIPAPTLQPQPQPKKAVTPAPLSPAPITPAPLAPQSTSSEPITPVPTTPPVPFLLLPFAVVTGLFDFICGLFGPPGRLLRSGFFKHIYGLAGLGLLAYTAAHVAQVQGWLTLPVTLPWPR